jgi:hypothetical protein
MLNACASPHISMGTKSIPERRDHTEAALLKLPTGTGKSGIIAVIFRCLPTDRKVLVLTPRAALTEQLLLDIRYRFWLHLGCEIQDGRLSRAAAAEFGAEHFANNHGCRDRSDERRTHRPRFLRGRKTTGPCQRSRTILPSDHNVLTPCQHPGVPLR